MARIGLFLLAPLLVSAPVSAQVVSSTAAPDTSVGQIGQRQTRDAVAEDAGVEPMARIGNRVPNRVENRIRNRIDPNYVPGANTTSAFVVAEERQRAASRSPR